MKREEEVCPTFLGKSTLTDLVARLNIHHQEHVKSLMGGKMKEANYETIIIETVSKEIASRSMEEREKWFLESYEDACRYLDEGSQNLYRLAIGRLSLFKRDFLQDSRYSNTEFVGL